MEIYLLLYGFDYCVDFCVGQFGIMCVGDKVGVDGVFQYVVDLIVFLQFVVYFKIVIYMGIGVGFVVGYFSG